MKLLQRSKTLSQEFLVSVAIEDPLQPPCQNGDLRIRRILVPSPGVSGFDHAGNHIVRILGPLRVPSRLEIPIVLENLANDLLLIGQDRQEIHLEHGVPDPLPIEGVARTGLQPAMFQGALRRSDLAHDTLTEHVLGQAHQFRVA